jgi:PAS domain S-box-containing protein
MSSEIRASLLYFIFASASIVVAHTLLAGMFAYDAQLANVVDTYHDWILVIVTPLFLYFLLRREFRLRAAGENATREREQSFRYLFMNNPHPMYVYDLETFAFIDVNDAAIHQYGYTRDELLAMTILDIRPPEEVPRLLQVQPPPRPSFQNSGEWRHRHKSGRIIDVEIVSHTLEFAGRRAALIVAHDVTERNKIQEALYESNDTLQSLVEASPVGIYVLDRAGTIKVWNPASQRIFGWNPEEVLGKPTPLVPADQLSAFESIRDRVLAGETINDIETQRRCKDGTVIDVTISTAPLYRADGITVDILALVADITDRKRAEHALREQRDIIETVNRVGQLLSGELELQKLVQVVTDAATELVHAGFGAFFYRMEGEAGSSYALHTLTGADWEKFAHFPMPRETLLFQPTLRGEGVIRLDDVKNDPRFGKNPPFNGMPEGHLPVSSYLAVPVVSRTGEVLGGLFLGHSEPGIFTERDERIVVGLAAQAGIAIDNARLYRKVRDEREWLHVTLSSIGDGVIAIDAQSRITFINGVAQALTGWSELEVCGQPLDTICRMINEQTRQPVESAVQKALRQNEIVGLSNHTMLISRDNREIPIDDYGAPIHDENGAVIGAILVIRDISQRKHMEADLLEKQRLRLALDKESELQKMRTRFMTMVSHEFRTPIATITIAADIIDRYNQRLSDEGRHEHLVKIQNQSKYLTELLDDIMTILKTQTIGPEYKPTTLDLAALCRKLVAETILSAQNTHEIEFNSTSPSAITSGDEKLLRHAIDNLLSNAVKYSPTGGTIQIDLWDNDNWIGIRVKDEGIGIPEKDIGHLFDPFHRASNVGDIPGTGLGLTITKQATELHGGTLDVESTVGKGTTFTLYLPVRVNQVVQPKA